MHNNSTMEPTSTVTIEFHDDIFNSFNLNTASMLGNIHRCDDADCFIVQFNILWSMQDAFELNAAPEVSAQANTLSFDSDISSIYPDADVIFNNFFDTYGHFQSYDTLWLTTIHLLYNGGHI